MCLILWSPMGVHIECSDAVYCYAGVVVVSYWDIGIWWANITMIHSISFYNCLVGVLGYLSTDTQAWQPDSLTLEGNWLMISYTLQAFAYLNFWLLNIPQLLSSIDQLNQPSNLIPQHLNYLTYINRVPGAADLWDPMSQLQSRLQLRSRLHYFVSVTYMVNRWLEL